MLIALLFSFSAAFANDPSTDPATELSQEDLAEYAKFLNEMVEFEQSLKYENGTITLKDGIAQIIVPEGFKYLNAADSDKILTDIWGNPPSKGDEKSLGLLVPEAFTIMNDSVFAINITYAKDGFIMDDDAKNINYDDLLKDMQSSEKEVNKLREKEGYPAIHLVGWASPPFYDAENKKLHWAQELKFGDYEERTLNYNIRILGRRGFLELNAIGGMEVLPAVKANIDPILSSVEFSEGHRYADFNPDLDKVAAYGIGGLIAGKVLLKTGIIAKFLLIFAKFWKIILLGGVGALAGLKSFFFKSKEEDNT